MGQHLHTTDSGAVSAISADTRHANGIHVARSTLEPVAGESETASPREVLRAARSVVLCFGALALTIPSAWASDAVESVAPMNAQEAVAVANAAIGVAPGNGGPHPASEPRINAKMSRKNRDQLIIAFQVAFERVREVPECQELFTELGADGTDTLGRVSVFPIGRHEAGANVCRGSVAYTYVGGGPTWICRKYWRLTDKQAAMIIIHEALHHAGLTERPRDANGMTAAAINRMIAKRCGL